MMTLYILVVLDTYYTPLEFGGDQTTNTGQNTMQCHRVMVQSEKSDKGWKKCQNLHLLEKFK